MNQTLDLYLPGKVTSEFARAIGGEAAKVLKVKKPEICCYGARGDRKTNSFLIGAVIHAKEHLQAGFPLPVKWMGVTDTYQAHKNKTIRSMELPHWAGAWQLKDDNHTALFLIDGVPLVHIDLFGIEDTGAKGRLRMECHGVWFEEPAPVETESSGIDETAWFLALTSARLKSHCNPAVITANYPDEDHWTWKRFVTEVPKGTVCYRIPPGENASAEDRAEWAEKLKDRPDLLKRLILGQPGSIQHGTQVAQGFNLDVHVSRERLYAVKGEPLFIGQDGGLTPTTIIGQAVKGFIRVLAALPCERGGIRQHFDNTVIPWIMNNATYALENRGLILAAYDPSMHTKDETDIDMSPIRLCEQMLPGMWNSGPVSWEGRKGPMLSSFNRHQSPGKAALQIDPVDGRPLINALSGRWYYSQDRTGAVSRDLPKKPNHPWEDLGDAYCYLLARMLPEQREHEPIKVESSFNVFDGDPLSVISDFVP